MTLPVYSTISHYVNVKWLFEDNTRSRPGVANLFVGKSDSFFKTHDVQRVVLVLTVEQPFFF